MLELLKEIGLSNIEIKVYEKLVVYGDQTILELSKLAKINRSYCYEVLERLLKKGFITKLNINNKVYWKALPRKNVIEYIEELKENIGKSLSKLDKKKLVRKNQI